MQLIKSTLDTRHQNSVIGNVTQFDDCTLELQILTDGVIDEAWEEPQFELLAMKRDNNPVRERDQDKFTILSKEEHRVQIELKEQFLTCRGTVKMQLIVKDGSRESTTLFYLVIAQSLDHDIVESHRDVKVLDDLEAYIQTGREVIYEAQEIVIGLKDDMSEFNTMSSEKEADRQASELNRASKELIRIDNEEDRVANEQVRVANEEIRVNNEEERVQNEQDRVTNETTRRLAENTRIAQERARQDAELQRNSIFEENENLRKEGEKTRVNNENERKKKFDSWEGRETTRLKSEENRIIQEQERVINEEERQRQEQTRQNQEDYRQRTYTQFNEAEASRVNKELQRQSAEEKRVAAEANRQSNYVESENERDRQYAEAEEIRNNAFEQNEANRQAGYTEAERDRVESEELRKARERDRESAETNRVNAETERVNAEQGRVDRFNSEIEKAKNTMETATTTVNEALKVANSTMTDIEERAEACLPVIEQSAVEIERNRVDYMGNGHQNMKDASDANVEYILGEVNTVHYESQHITATDTIEKQVRSAILKGQTLVNLVNKNTQINTSWNTPSETVTIGDSDITISLNDNAQGINVLCELVYLLKPNTKYIIIGNVSTKTENHASNYLASYVIQWYKDKVYKGGAKLVNNLRNQVFTTGEDFDNIEVTCYGKGFIGSVTFDYPIILEYQDGMENWDIPYFEGMKSVQMPVLKTVGKNLLCNENIVFNDSEDRVYRKIYLKPNTDYYMSAESEHFFSYRVMLCKNDGSVGKPPTELIQLNVNGSRNFNSGNHSGEFIVLFHAGGLYTNYANKWIQIEQGTQTTTYEPHKSNILSTPEDVELRGIGDVQDTLDLLTGEKVERIGEFVFDGSEDITWSVSSDSGNLINTRSFMFKLNTANVIHKSGFCSHFIHDYSRNDYEHYYLEQYDGNDYTNIVFFKNINDLSEASSNGFNQWLSENPITLQYAFAEESVKTVDLSDYHVYSYKDTTHYDCSAAEGSLIPTLSIDVPTNLPALVSRQRATINVQKEQIQTLESENEQLIAQNEVQDVDISLNQDAINFMLFAPATMSVNDESRNNEGVNTMAAYLANQILKGKLDYTLVVSRYGSYKEDIDTILIAEGKQDLIK